MTTPVYALPFASTKAVSPVVVRLGDTKPVVIVTMVDGAGEPVDSAEWTTTLELFNAMGDESEIVGEYDTAVFAWYFLWASAPAESEFRSEIKVENGGDTVHYPGPRVYVYDPANLWADPQTVIALAGGGYSTDEAVVAILLATEAVRAWATVPVPSPVPDAVRGAVAILAARVLTTPPPGSNDAVPVISERIGDYSVRYADQGQGMDMSGEVAGLIAWLHPGAYSVDVGPKDGEAHAISSGYAPPLITEEEEVVP